MKKFLFWLLAFLITAGLSYYQRKTGPTNPKAFKAEIAGQQYELKLPRSGVDKDKTIAFEGLPAGTQGCIHWHRYPTSDPFTSHEMTWNGDKLEGFLPVQPAAGKLQYYVTIDGKDYFKDEPLTIRFRNNVPAGIMISHILLMFLAMLFACHTLILCIAKDEGYRRQLIVTTIIFFLGGFVFGPLMQHHAFGVYWSGFPFGGDVTDNKTLISFLLFVLALAFRKSKHSRSLAIGAVLVMMLVFSIPHSTRGSEYNYETGTVQTE